MGKTRLLAYPINEGLIVTPKGRAVIWRDYQWNTGEIERSWLVDPSSISGSEVTVRPSPLKRNGFPPSSSTSPNGS